MVEIDVAMRLFCFCVLMTKLFFIIVGKYQQARSESKIICSLILILQSLSMVTESFCNKRYSGINNGCYFYFLSGASTSECRQLIRNESRWKYVIFQLHVEKPSHVPHNPKSVFFTVHIMGVKMVAAKDVASKRLYELLFFLFVIIISFTNSHWTKRSRVLS